MGFFILEIIGVILFLACIAFYFFYPVERDRFLFGTKSWLGSLSFCCILVIGLVLTISFCNHIGFLNGHGRLHQSEESCRLGLYRIHIRQSNIRKLSGRQHFYFRESGVSFR